MEVVRGGKGIPTKSMRGPKFDFIPHDVVEDLCKPEHKELYLHYIRLKSFVTRVCWIFYARLALNMIEFVENFDINILTTSLRDVTVDLSIDSIIKSFQLQRGEELVDIGKSSNTLKTSHSDKNANGSYSIVLFSDHLI